MADVEGLKQALRDQMQTVFESAADLMRGTAADAAPIDTGQLRDGVQVEAVTAGDVITGRIVSTARAADGTDYGEIQDRGTGPIYPVNAKVLRFVIAGVVVFARSTSGVPATHWWTDSITQANWSDAVTAARP